MCCPTCSKKSLLSVQELIKFIFNLFFYRHNNSRIYAAVLVRQNFHSWRNYKRIAPNYGGLSSGLICIVCLPRWPVIKPNVMFLSACSVSILDIDSSVSTIIPSLADIVPLLIVLLHVVCYLERLSWRCALQTFHIQAQKVPDSHLSM